MSIIWPCFCIILQRIKWNECKKKLSCPCPPPTCLPLATLTSCLLYEGAAPHEQLSRWLFKNSAAGPWNLVLYAEIFITVLSWKRRCSISQLWTPSLQAKRLLQSNYGGTVDCLCRSSPWKTHTNIERKHFIKFSGLDNPKPTYVPGFFQTNQSIINEQMDTTYCLVLQEIYSTQIMFMLEMRLVLECLATTEKQKPVVT